MAGGQVQLRELVKRFDDVTAVDGINARIAGGEFFSMLGPSGCGKTTTVRMIAGFERPAAGEILLDGTDVAGVPPHERNVHTVQSSITNTGSTAQYVQGTPVSVHVPPDALRVLGPGPAETSVEPDLLEPQPAVGIGG